jgi:hypothetical protein
MSLSHHHQRQLYRIEAGLLRADPQLAEMLGIFGRARPCPPGSRCPPGGTASGRRPP